MSAAPGRSPGPPTRPRLCAVQPRPWPGCLPRSSRTELAVGGGRSAHSPGRRHDRRRARAARAGRAVRRAAARDHGRAPRSVGALRRPGRPGLDHLPHAGPPRARATIAARPVGARRRRGRPGAPHRLGPAALRADGRRMSVLVCENPRVLEAVAERRGGRVAAVCTSGQPALVVLDVLARSCRRAAALPRRLRLARHRDREPARRRGRGGAVADGRRHTSRSHGPLPLAGAPVDPVWDAELGAAMRHHGVAVHEEAVLGDLLAALATD